MVYEETPTEVKNLFEETLSMNELLLLLMKIAVKNTTSNLGSIWMIDNSSKIKKDSNITERLISEIYFNLNSFMKFIKTPAKNSQALNCKK